MVRCRSCPVPETLRERLAGKRAAADRRLRLRRQGRAGPDRPRAARDRRSRSCCAATPTTGSQNQVLTTAPFEGLDGSRRQVPSAATSATTTSSLPGGIDVVIHCAASVSFEQTLDEALELNGKGPARLLEALRKAGSDPYFIHVSHRLRRGPAHRAWCSRSRRAPRRASPGWTSTPSSTPRAPGAATSRPSRGCPVHQHRFVKEAERAVGPAGGPATGTRAEILRYEWVRDQLVERGRERARALGWSDTYTLSKAIGERTLIAANPRQLTIVRPAIVESALHHALPGLDGVAEGRRPDPARLRRRHHPRPLRRQQRDPHGPDPGRLRRQRLRRRPPRSRRRTAPCAR